MGDFFSASGLVLRCLNSMEIDGVEKRNDDGVTSLVIFDPELLQIPEVSSQALKENPGIVEELYKQWLSLPQTGKLVFVVVQNFFVMRNMYTIA